MYILLNSYYMYFFIAAKQSVKQLSNVVLSGRNSLIMRKQIKAGSLANLFPCSEFEESEVERTSPKIKRDHLKKERTLHVNDDRNVERDFIPCEYLYMKQ